MSFEQPAYSFSYPGGEPPTPTKTPTSPNFFLNSFQTPKQDSRSHGPFSPWSPPLGSLASPNCKTPTRLSFTTSIKSPTKSSAAENAASEAVSHVYHSSHDPQLSLPSSELPRRLSSSPSPSLNSKTKRRRLDKSESSVTPLKTTFDQDSGQSMRSAGSMQTPPPTSTSASRRKAQQAQVARLVKESAEKGRRMSFPALTKTDNMDGAASQVEGSPQQYAALQFSPDGFAFPTSGPATAPVYPQHKLFWDPEQNGDMNIDFPMDDDFTTFGTQKNLDPFVSQLEGGGIHFPTSPALNLLGTGTEKLNSLNDMSHEARPASAAAAMTRKPSRGNGVDPSLLFSSPGRATEASSMPPTSQKIQDDNLLPYAHQLRDAQMELDMQISRKPKRKRGPETDSPAVEAALQTLRDDQAGVRRDLVDDLIASSAAQRPRSRTPAGHSRQKQGAKQNPVQKQRDRTCLNDFGGTLPQHKRTSVTLTIDASGRAKTETKVLTTENRSPRARMELDGDEDSDSTSSSSNDGMTMSQKQSFSYPQKQKQPKLGRFTHKSQSHSQKSSYASTLGSTKNPRIESEIARRPSSNLFLQSNAQTQHPRVSFNADARDDLESEAETVVDSEDDRGDAQSALKKVLQSRQKGSSKQSRSRNDRVEQQSAYLPPVAPSNPYYMGESFTPARYGYNQAYNNISPTTITDPDLATPSSARSNISSDSVRCLCHTTEDDGQLMIQW